MRGSAASAMFTPYFAMNRRTMAWVKAPPWRFATRPANTVSSFLGSRYCCWIASGGNKRWAPGEPKILSGTAFARCGRYDTIAAMALPPPLLDARHLRKRYGGSTVVDDLSFAIAPGECLGVIGPNGAGKTTTIRMCLGLVVPDEGSITAFGMPMPDEALAIKAQVGVVSQFD